MLGLDETPDSANAQDHPASGQKLAGPGTDEARVTFPYTHSALWTNEAGSTNMDAYLGLLFCVSLCGALLTPGGNFNSVARTLM